MKKLSKNGKGKGVLEKLVVKISQVSRSYEIVIAESILDRLYQFVQSINASTWVIVSSSDIWALHGKTLLMGLRPFKDQLLLHIVNKLGEEYIKSSTAVDALHTLMLQQGVDRHAVVIAFGGGVIGDMAGYAASVYMRGIRFVQIPTTLLAQVDSSIGGKTGINHLLGKNLIGTFAQPCYVSIDPAILATLPVEEIRNGLAEIVKYGVIADSNLFNYLEEWFDDHQVVDFHAFPLTFWIKIIKTSCAIKAEIVAQDEKESGIRAILNFGHTLGHALENIIGYGKIKHGEAVSIGMVFAANIGVQRGLCTIALVNRLCRLLTVIGLPTKLPIIDQQLVMNVMKVDKKNYHGSIQLILPVDIGKVVIVAVQIDEIFFK